MKINASSDEYEEYDFFDYGRSAHRKRTRTAPRKRKMRPTHQPNPLAGIQEMDDGIANWIPSYAASLDPRHHERRWVIESAGPFYHDQIITDLTHLVKGGKEANVYRCDAHPATGLEYIAAKLYRPRMLRHLKNDAVYKAGRQLRDDSGKQIKGRRVKLALRKKTAFGKSVDIQWWIGNEYRTQTLLYEAGTDVPKPVAHQGNTILMAFIGNEYGPAPLLSEIRLEREEAHALFRQVMDNVALMLEHHLVHGDLSAYNILYWEGDITLIDFPQMVEAQHNPHAFELLRRDITRVCDYFARFGVKADPLDLTLDLWRPYMGRDW